MDLLTSEILPSAQAFQGRSDRPYLFKFKCVFADVEIGSGGWAVGSVLLQNNKILLVSDLPSESAELERTLSAASDGAPVCTLSDQDEALRRVERSEFGTVLCASQAGALASTFFLNEVWKRNPNTTRFVLDGFADPGTIVRCLLGAHHFIPTPCTENSLRDSLTRAESVKEFLKNDQIRTLLSRMRTLPSKPTVYLDVTRELRNPEPSVDRISDIISKDLAVSTKLIQVVNSPYYGPYQPITELRDAVVFLGLETIESIVTSIEAFARFDKIKPLYFTADRVWKHSVTLADAAKKICRLAGRNGEVVSQAYLGALLHDIGKLALAENFPDDYNDLVQSAEKQNRFVFELEVERFGASHADAGAYLLALWGLPLPIVQAVSSHHASYGTFNELTPASVVHFTEQMFATREPVESIVQRYAPELGFRSAVDQLRQLAPLRMKSGDVAKANAQQPTGSVGAASRGRQARGLTGIFGRLWK